MDKKERLLKKALSGDTAAKQKLRDMYEGDIRFICSCLMDDRDNAEKTGNWALNTLDTDSSKIRTVDEFTRAARLSAVSAALKSDSASVPAAVQEENTVLPVLDKTVMLPEAAMKDEAVLSHAGELMYYCTGNYEYRFFILFYYCHLEIQEIAQLYKTDIYTVAAGISDAENGIRSSVQTISPDSSKVYKTDFYRLTEAVAAIRPAEKKQRKPVMNPRTKKIAGIAAFCAAMLLIVFAIFFAAFRNVNNEDNEDNENKETAYYLKSDHRNNNEILTEDHSSGSLLYNYLITNRTVSLSESGLSGDGFVVESDKATLLELIVIDSSSELINSGQLEITFSDGSPLIENGKRFFTQTVYPIDERTFLIRIYAPGYYSPDQFSIDLYMYGLKDSSYILPDRITGIRDISGLNIISDNNQTNKSAQEHGIIALHSGSVGKELNYYYIESSLSYITESDENIVLGTAELTLLPIGSKYGKPDEDSFTFELGQYPESLAADKKIETKCILSPETDSDTLPYITKLVFDISMNFPDSSEENKAAAEDILRGCFVYNNPDSPLRIELERY